MSLMPLEIEQREAEGIVILDLKRRLSLHHQDSLRQTLQDLFNHGQRNVIVDLRHVSTLDSEAIEILIVCGEEFQNAGGRIVLLNGVPHHVAPEDLLKLDTALQAYSDEQSAINSFFPDRAVPHYDLLKFLETVKHEAEPQKR